MQFTFWFGTGMGLALILVWLTMRYLLQKSFHLDQVPQVLKPEDFHIPARELFLKTQNGKKIQVYCIGEENTGPITICIHGWENTAEKFFPLTQFLIQKNFRVILLNTRNHGASDPDGYSTMIQFGQDLQTVYNFALKLFEVTTQVFLIGHSLGGATVLYKSAHMQNISGVVSIASFADLKKILSNSFLRKHFPRRFLPFVLRYIEWSVGDRFDNLSPLENIKKINCPVLLMHGESDIVVPVQALHQLKAAAHQHQVRTEIIAGADHSSLLDEAKTFNIIYEFMTSV